MTRDILLVHGSFHSGRCWDALMDDLRADEWNPAVVTLPGHEARSGRRWSVRWSDYTEAVVRAARATPSGRPVVVGHSMGGHVVCGAVEADPSAFSGVTFISAAVAAPTGSTVLHMVVTDAMKRAVVPSALKGTMRFRTGRAVDVFYNTCSAAVAVDAAAWLVPQPIRPIARSRVVATEQGMGSMPLTYIECLRDNALAIDQQRAFQRQLRLADVVTIDSDHSPFLSARSETVAALNRFWAAD
ncbi:MAG: alpha/beta fold hydrolase [Nocardioides sp.]|jgi:pimeloyl-ACP methyl ester carboxylesterase